MRLVGAFQTRFVDFVVRKAGGDLIECDTCFEPSQRLPNAKVLPVAEVDLALRLAGQVQSVRFVELAFVAACGPRDQRDAMMPAAHLSAPFSPSFVARVTSLPTG